MPKRVGLSFSLGPWGQMGNNGSGNQAGKEPPAGEALEIAIGLDDQGLSLEGKPELVEPK